MTEVAIIPMYIAFYIQIIYCRDVIFFLNIASQQQIQHSKQLGKYCIVQKKKKRRKENVFYTFQNNKGNI